MFSIRTKFLTRVATFMGLRYSNGSCEKLLPDDVLVVGDEVQLIRSHGVFVIISKGLEWSSQVCFIQKCFVHKW